MKSKQRNFSCVLKEPLELSLGLSKKQKQKQKNVSSSEGYLNSSMSC